MREPDFRELVGDEGTPEELAQLRRAHDLLLAAGPPPELSPALGEAPRVGGARLIVFRRPRVATAFALAAAVAAGVFVAGYAVGNHHRTGFSAARTISMHGVGKLASARASVAIGSQDVGGNYPLKMRVTGLPSLPQGGWYELLLSSHGRPTLSCGSFSVDGRALTVRLTVPYDLSQFRKLFDGWVVVKHTPAQRTAPVVMTT
jgi:hypothetical protein